MKKFRQAFAASFQKRNYVVALAAMTVLSVSAPASAATIDFSLVFDENTILSSNTPATGASATIDFDFSDGGAGLVNLALTIANTTDSTTFGAGATAGQLTAFGFDITGSTFNSFTGGNELDTLIQDEGLPPASIGSPIFDLVAADNSNLLGGNANFALSEGDSDIVTFVLNSALSASDLAAAFIAGFNDGSLETGLRFQQVNAGAGSDQIAFNPPNTSVVPLPAALWFMIAGLGALSAARRAGTTA